MKNDYRLGNWASYFRITISISGVTVGTLEIGKGMGPDLFKYCDQMILKVC